MAKKMKHSLNPKIGMAIFAVIVIILLFWLFSSSSTSSTQNTNYVSQSVVREYVCPDGSTASSPDACPKPSVYDKLAFDTTQVNFYISREETDTEYNKYIQITNTGTETVRITDCIATEKYEVDEWKPRIVCWKWDQQTLIGYNQNFVIAPLKTEGVGIRATVNKKQHIISNGQDLGIVTVLPGVYEADVSFYDTNNKVFKTILIKVTVS